MNFILGDGKVRDHLNWGDPTKCDTMTKGNSNVKQPRTA